MAGGESGRSVSELYWVFHRAALEFLDGVDARQADARQLELALACVLVGELNGMMRRNRAAFLAVTDAVNALRAGDLDGYAAVLKRLEAMIPASGGPVER